MTSNGILDVPPTSSNVTSTNPVSSEPVYCFCANLTLISIITLIHFKLLVHMCTTFTPQTKEPVHNHILHCFRKVIKIIHTVNSVYSL